MKPPLNPIVKFGLIAAFLCLGIVAALQFRNSPGPVTVQDDQKTRVKKEQTEKPTGPPPSASTNVSPAALTNAPPPGVTNAAPPAAKPEPSTAQAAAPGPSETPALKPPEQSPAPPQTNIQAKAEQEQLSPTDQIQLSFQGANVDMVVQWLAKTTGKSVVKHPKVQCQLTIVSSKKLTLREAVTLVYRALALESFTTIESSKSILIVPEGQEPKLSPELVDGSRTEIPEGRQRLIKVFPLQHVQPGELREKVRGVLSEKATIEVDDRANQMIVTDYNDNLRLLGELIKELDITSVSDSVIEIYTLKYAQAEDLSNLLSLILNAQSGSPSSQRKSSLPPSGGGPMPSGGPPPSSGPPQPPSGESQAPSQQIKLWPDKTANRLIVAAPKSKLPEIKKLIDILDTDKPEDVGVRVIPLKIVSAEDLVKELAPLYQKMSGKSLKDIIEVTASSRANSLIVLSSEANFKAIEKLMATLDTEDAQEKIMQAFPLRNADAEDVAKQLKDLSQDQDSQSRYPYYFFSSSSSGGKSSKKMSVVADRRRNTVIVQAPPGSMEYRQMIKTLDEPVTDSSLAPKIFALKYVSAVDIEGCPRAFSQKQQQQRPYWYYDDYPQETADRNVGRFTARSASPAVSIQTPSSSQRIRRNIWRRWKKS